MSRSNESSRGQDVPGDVKDAFESLEKKLDAGLADLMADEGNSRPARPTRTGTDDDDDDGDDTAKDSLAALAAADDAAREAEAMARSMAEEAASFAATVASTTVGDNATSAEERIEMTTEMTRLSPRDEEEDNREEAELLQQKAALAASARQKGKGKSPKQISILLLGLIGLILALGAGSVFHRTRSTHPEATEHDDSTQTLFDIIKEWNVKHEKEERYNEAMRNMLNPRREGAKDAGEQHNAHQEEYKQETIPHDHEEQQYLISGDGQMAKLINAMYQPVYYVTYRPVQRLRYYYYHQTPSQHQEEVVVRQSRSGGAVTYRKARVVQNVHHNRSF